jgi:hypothetical protein
MANQIVPVNTSPGQTFNVTLNIDSTLVQINGALNFNEMAGYWVMNLFDVNYNPLILCVPLLTGTYPAANLLVQQQYLKIGSWFIIDLTGTGGYPDQTNLGTSYLLLVSDTPPVTT